MSRVARKKLEKEARKKNRKLIFGNKKAKSTDFKEEKIENVDEALNRDKKEKNNTSPSKIKEETNKRELEVKTSQKEVTESTLLNKDNTIIIKDIGVKTADKIISVEDERMYYERKKKNIKKASPMNVLTVNDIHTAEEEGQNIKETTEVLDKEKPVESDINEIKRLNIENAPFEDVVKVAKSRLEPQINEKKELEEKKRQEELRKKELAEKKRLEELAKEELIEKETKENEVAKVEDKDLKKDNQETLSGQEKEGNIESDAILEDEKLSEKEDDLKEDKDKVSADSGDNKIEENKEDIEEEEDEFSDENDDQEVEEKKTGRLKRFFKKLFMSLLILLILVYLAGCVVFHNRFFVNTKINGMNVGFMTPAKVDQMAENRVKGYKIVLKGRNKVKDELLGSDVDMKYIKDGSVNKLKEEQGFWAWPVYLFTDDVMDGRLNVEVNEDELKEKVKDFNIFKKEYVKEPVSAYPRYDEKKKELVVDKGDLGSDPIEYRVINFVKNAIKAESLSEDYPDSVYKKQKNTADDPRIKRAIAEMKKAVDMKIVYDFGYEKYILDGKEISKMFNVDSENNYKVVFSKENVRDFVRSLSRKYSTYGDTREIPSASTGGKLKVSGGVYGWLIDRDGETDALVKIIQDGKNIDDRKPLYKQTAMSRDKNDMGNEFIEIDLSKQYMWFVRDGQAIVATPIVSGNPNKGDATPPGIYPITYKTRNAVLRGPGYASPVSFWIPFNGNIGIHDASWQPVYGGSRYLYAGSHGCINTPYSKVAEIYKLAKEGMPVVVHY